MLVYYILIAILVGVDQLVKFWTVSTLDLHETMSFIPNVLSFFYLQNDGAAWGMLSGQMWLFYIITVVVVIALVVMLHQEGKQSKFLATGLAFMIAGALGNFIDRLHLNYVIDMFQLEFMNFPIFNVADVCLTIGVIIMLLYVLLANDDSPKKKRVK